MDAKNRFEPLRGKRAVEAFGEPSKQFLLDENIKAVVTP